MLFYEARFTNATVVDDAIRLVSKKSEEKVKSSTGNTNEDNKESNELDYDEGKDQIEEKQAEVSEEIITTTTNQVF